jgi:hypothetical protein
MLVEDWKSDNAANVFVAAAGYHHFRIMIEWKYKNNPNDTGTHGYSKTSDTLISGWEKPGGYNHPGLFSSTDELDQMCKNINKDPLLPMSVAYKILSGMRTTRQYIDGSKNNVYPSRLDNYPEPLDSVRFFLRDENDKLYEKLGICTRERDVWEHASNAIWANAIVWVVTKTREMPINGI